MGLGFKTGFGVHCLGWDPFRKLVLEDLMPARPCANSNHGLGFKTGFGVHCLGWDPFRKLVLEDLMPARPCANSNHGVGFQNWVRRSLPGSGSPQEIEPRGYNPALPCQLQILGWALKLVRRSLPGLGSPQEIEPRGSNPARPCQLQILGWASKLGFGVHCLGWDPLRK